MTVAGGENRAERAMAEGLYRVGEVHGAMNHLDSGPTIESKHHVWSNELYVLRPHVHYFMRPSQTPSDSDKAGGVVTSIL